jgi:hypothetical protein
MCLQRLKFRILCKAPLLRRPPDLPLTIGTRVTLVIDVTRVLLAVADGPNVIKNPVKRNERKKDTEQFLFPLLRFICFSRVYGFFIIIFVIQQII